MNSSAEPDQRRVPVLVSSAYEALCSGELSHATVDVKALRQDFERLARSQGIGTPGKTQDALGDFLVTLWTSLVRTGNFEKVSPKTFLSSQSVTSLGPLLKAFDESDGHLQGSAFALSLAFKVLAHVTAAMAPAKKTAVLLPFLEAYNDWLHNELGLSDGWTVKGRYSPLISAVLSGDEDLVRMAVRKGSLVNDFRLTCQQSPIAVAFKRNRPSVFSLLLELGADVTTLFSDGLNFLSTLFKLPVYLHDEKRKLEPRGDEITKCRLPFLKILLDKKPSVVNFPIESRSIEVGSVDLLGQAVFMSASFEEVEFVISVGEANGGNRFYGGSLADLSGGPQ
jgi:hypothetical protein